MGSLKYRERWNHITSMPLSGFKGKRFHIFATSIPGKPRVTKHHRLTPWPQVPEYYLKYAAAITIHNHYWSSSCALADIWHTKNPRRRELAGTLDFCFTNGYLRMKYCSNSNLQGNSLKITAAFALTSHKTSSMIKTRQLNTSTEAGLHTLEKIPNSRCYICRHS